MEHSPESTTAFPAWFTVIQSLWGLTEVPHSHILCTSGLASAGRMESLQFLHSAQDPACKGDLTGGTHLHTQSGEWDWRSPFSQGSISTRGGLNSFFKQKEGALHKALARTPKRDCQRGLWTL